MATNFEDKIDRTGLFGYKAWSNSGPNCKSVNIAIAIAMWIHCIVLSFSLLAYTVLSKKPPPKTQRQRGNNG